MKLRIPTIKLSSAETPKAEIGSSGLTYGFLGRLVEDEYLRDLSGKSGYTIYDRMRKSYSELCHNVKALTDH